MCIAPFLVYLLRC